jgi:HK97 family phage major capsid protein
MDDDIVKELKEISEVVKEMKATHAAFQETNTARMAEIEAKGVADPLTVEKQQKIEQRLDDLDSMKQTIERLEVLASRPAPAGKAQDWTPVQVKHAEAFEAWLRKPDSNERKQALMQAGMEAKAVSSDSGSAGNAIPEIIGSRIQETLQLMSPMRQVLNVVTVGSSDYKELVDVNGEDGGWVGEQTTRAETNTPAVQQVAPTFGEVYAYPKIYEHIMDDSFFDIQSWVVRKIALTFARLEGIAWISGNGTNKPTGFLTATESAIGDFDSPARTFGHLQYLPTGVAGNFQNDLLGSPAGDPFAVFDQAIEEMRPMWRMGAVWLMNTKTKGILRRFRDADGRYLLRSGLEAGEGNLIMGYRIQEMDHMPDVGANTSPVVFGNFPEAYLACERTSLRITTDNNITTPGTVKFYARKRVGGILRQDQAIKKIKCAVS